VQPLWVSPAEPPYRPAGHSVPVLLPTRQNEPGGQGVVQLLPRACTSDMVPAAHRVQLVAPSKEYDPGAHAAVVPVVEPGGQKKPAGTACSIQHITHRPENIGI
jgi:hypothetical protein